MNLISFVGTLGRGGTEKAACRWAWGLKERGHSVTVLSMIDGPRRAELEQHNVPIHLVNGSAHSVVKLLEKIKPAVIHTHCPGQPHIGDVLGEALKPLPKIPVVQTNIFGHLYNPLEDAWTDYRLFVSWSSCVQAAWRVFRRLDEKFFRRASVAVNPLDAEDGPGEAEVRQFRESLGVQPGEVLFGQLCRPDMGRWTEMPLRAFRRALRECPRFKFLIREPPAEIARLISRSPDAGHFLLLPLTADAGELRKTIGSLDAVLHYSSVGESFGYGIAEPMNLGKPAVVNFMPWHNMAPLELVGPGECGFACASEDSMARAIVKLGSDGELRRQMGQRARDRIRDLANPEVSLTRLETILQTAIERRDNPMAAEDLQRARDVAAYLKTHQFGDSWKERIGLRPFFYRVRFQQFRRAVRLKFGAKS